MDESTLERLAVAIAEEVRRQLQGQEASAVRSAPPASPTPLARLFVVVGDGEVSESRLAELERLREEPIAVTVLLCDSLAQPEVVRSRLPFARFLTCADAKNPLPLMESHDVFLLPQVGRRRLSELVALSTSCGGNGVILEALAAGKPVYAVESGFTDLLHRWRSWGTVGGRAMAQRLLDLRAEWSRWGVVWLPEANWLSLLRQAWQKRNPATPLAPSPSGRGRPLVTAADVEAVQGGELVLPPNAIVTPLARDVARQRGIRLRWERE